MASVQPWKTGCPEWARGLAGPAGPPLALTRALTQKSWGSSTPAAEASAPASNRNFWSSNGGVLCIACHQLARQDAPRTSSPRQHGGPQRRGCLSSRRRRQALGSTARVLATGALGAAVRRAWPRSKRCRGWLQLSLFQLISWDRRALDAAFDIPSLLLADCGAPCWTNMYICLKRRS